MEHGLKVQSLSGGRSFYHLDGWMKIRILDILLLPKDDRRQGKGTEIMQKLCGWADVEEVTLVLSADSTVCGRAGSETEDRQLVAFYEKHGFRRSQIEYLHTDSIRTSKNIMERPPEPILSDQIVRLRDYA